LAAPENTGVRRPHKASITQQLDCKACHTAAGWKTISGSAGDSGFDHARTGFPLSGRHRGAACSDCHNSTQAVTRECSGCHEDAHQAQLGAACDHCHSANSWLQTDAIARHRQTRLPLTGMHALTDCQDCHLHTSERQWSSPPADCFACHAADYRRPDVHPLHSGTPGDPTSALPRDCSICHRPNAWIPAFVPSGTLASAGLALEIATSHDRVFPLSFGRHRGLDCGACHVSGASPRAVRCNGCHAHNEITLQRQHEKVPGFGSSCLGCHPAGTVR
jgi:hypothetical protein